MLALAACSKDEPVPSSSPLPRSAASGSASPSSSLAPPVLAVTIDGKLETWRLDRVPHFITKNTSGQEREAWSLREVAKLAGPDARVTAVLGTPRLDIDQATWSGDKIPIIHRTRRGGMKFRWTDNAGTWNDAEVKDVTGLELLKTPPPR